jgi:membrane protein
MRISAKATLGLMKEAGNSWSADYAPSMGAALSYYTLFSIAPLLIIVIAVAGLFFGADAVRGVIFAQLQALMGDEGARAIQDMLSSASRPTTGGFATVASIVGLLVGATTVFNELQSDLDRIWRAPAQVKATGIWTLLRTRLLSFGMVLAVAFLLVVSLIASAAIATLGKWWGAWFGEWEALAYALDMIDAGGASCLVVASVESVAGSASGLARVLSRVKDAAGCFVALDDGVDTTTREGAIAAALLVAVTRRAHERGRPGAPVERKPGHGAPTNGGADIEPLPPRRAPM